jgi:hypothetical protein
MAVTCTALQIVKFTTEERLQEIMQTSTATTDVRINDPHVFIVEDGKAGGALSQAILDVKKRFDPLGLLNPGKVRAWPDPQRPQPDRADPPGEGREPARPCTSGP